MVRKQDCASGVLIVYYYYCQKAIARYCLECYSDTVLHQGRANTRLPLFLPDLLLLEFTELSFILLVGDTVSTSTLRQQQIHLGLLKAARVLFSRQDNLRQILSHQSYAVSGTFSLQQLISSAIKPSPIKALFDREELEVSVEEL